MYITILIHILAFIGGMCCVLLICSLLEELRIEFKKGFRKREKYKWKHTKNEDEVKDSE